MHFAPQTSSFVIATRAVILAIHRRRPRRVWPSAALRIRRVDGDEGEVLRLVAHQRERLLFLPPPLLLAKLVVAAKQKLPHLARDALVAGHLQPRRHTIEVQHVGAERDKKRKQGG